MAIERMYKPKEAAARLRFSVTQLRRYSNAGELQAMCVLTAKGRKTRRYSEQALQAFIERHTEQPQPKMMSEWLEKHFRRVEQGKARKARKAAAKRSDGDAA